MFYVNGAARDSAMCGDTIVFDVPGYAEVWLTQYQNNTLQYDNRYTVPSPPYKLSCPQDVGIFVGKAYELVNGQKGPAITSWTFPVTAPASSLVPPPTQVPGGQPPGAGPSGPGGQGFQPGGQPGPTTMITEQPYVPPMVDMPQGPPTLMSAIQNMDSTTLLLIAVAAYFLFFRKSR